MTEIDNEEDDFSKRNNGDKDKISEEARVPSIKEQHDDSNESPSTANDSFPTKKEDDGISCTEI